MRAIHRLATIAALAVSLAAPAAAGAALFEVEGSFGSAPAGDGRFGDPAAVATDDAGRVYVADAAAGRVEVYDSARGDNAFLRTVGDEVLNCPAGIRIDNRGRIYVSDACRDMVVMFDSFVDGAPVRREFGGGGTEVGRLSSPRAVDVDHSARVYVVERGNVRVQAWRPSGGRQVPVTAFGVGQAGSFFEPEGIARDRSGRFYLSDASSGDGEVRIFDRRGSYLERIAGPGTGPGQVSTPRGLMLDPLGRLLVADSGNGRIQAFAAPPGAGPDSGPGGEVDEGEVETGRIAQNVSSRFVEAFGSAFTRPADLALAPGAMLYVTDAGTGRVVRLRYDDADRDGALDLRDTCPNLFNPAQVDTDRDRAGDECDGDDDNDTVADGSDRCPRTRRGTDGNGDGCGDPVSRISSPRSGKTFNRRRPPAITGSASADELGVTGVEFALARVRGGTCSWWNGSRFGPGASCDQPVWVAAAGTPRWRAAVRLRSAGRYRVMSRATQAGGLVESVFNRRNRHDFRIR